MRKFMIYGIDIIGYDGYREGVEYFLNRKERDKRLEEMSAAKKEPFEFMLSNKTAWKLNYHGKAKDKRTIDDLKLGIIKLQNRLEKIASTI